MSLLPYEKETHVNMSATSDKMRIFTTEKSIMRKLDRYVAESENWKVVEIGTVKGEVVSKIYEAPRELLLMRKKKRTLTESQRQAAAERLKEYWEKKKNGEPAEEDDLELDFTAEEEPEDSQVEPEAGTMVSEEENENTEASGKKSSAGENPRLEPQKSKPKIVKTKSVIAEMEAGR